VNANAVYGVYVTASVSLDGTNYGPAEVVADFPSGSGEATVNAPSASKVLVTVTNRDITPATVTVVAEQF
jgi:MinD-like ATPase involved in chromosome partitioning or flagellar assembly